jgi:lipid-binding SYLF domain-containing protein
MREALIQQAMATTRIAVRPKLESFAVAVLEKGVKAMTRKSLICSIVVCSLLISVASALAEEEKQTKEMERVEAAVAAMQEIENIPESTIPETLMGKAAGIAIIPHVVKAGFVVGGEHGSGVLCVREKDGTWSRPVFMSLTGGSIGWQLGVEATDVILVFMRKENIDDILKGEFTLGADASVAAGPVGRKASAGTNDELNSEIYSYSRSRGAFAGMTINGSKLYLDGDANVAFYNAKKIGPQTIVYDEHLITPPDAEKLMKTLDVFSKPKMTEKDKEKKY